jgi:hypothetical protein
MGGGLVVGGESEQEMTSCFNTIDERCVNANHVSVVNAFTFTLSFSDLRYVRFESECERWLGPVMSKKATMPLFNGLTESQYIARSC